MNAKLSEISAAKLMKAIAPRLSCSPENFAILTGPPSSWTDRSPVNIWPMPVTIMSTIPIE